MLEETPSEDIHGVRIKDKDGVSRLRAKVSAWYLGDDIAKPTRHEIEADHHGHDDPLQIEH